MKKIFLFIIMLVVMSGKLSAINLIKDSLTRQQFIKSQTVKADTLNQIALTLATPGARSADLNEAINYIMEGLHIYSKFRDSTGLRETFDHLALVYHLQKKYVQAKWFYIQSNSLSRDMRDTLNIIHSLLNLSAVKTDIKDYPMAQRDLRDALSLAGTIPGIDLQVEVQNSIARFYTKKGNADKAAAALYRIAFLTDSVSQAKQMALNQQQQKAKELADKQKQLILQQKQFTEQKLTKEKNGITTIAVMIIALLAVVCFIVLFKRKQ
ncbi:hypothetical protein [Mucilaginibacter paludis]|nr:hypothetical protein [Mucilaginibacter paludis]